MDDNEDERQEPAPPEEYEPPRVEWLGNLRDLVGKSGAMAVEAVDGDDGSVLADNAFDALAGSGVIVGTGGIVDETALEIGICGAMAVQRTSGAARRVASVSAAVASIIAISASADGP